MNKLNIQLKIKLEDNIKAHKNILKLSNDIIDIINIVYKKLNKGGKLLFCGNGGSAADAQHIAAEFIVRLRPGVNRNPIPAFTLAQDTSTLTACSNDYSFDDIFLDLLKLFLVKMMFLYAFRLQEIQRIFLKF